LKKKKSQKMADGIAQVVGPEFKSQYHKTKQTKKNPHTDILHTIRMAIAENAGITLCVCVQGESVRGP
jgi:hypothetical protein